MNAIALALSVLSELPSLIAAGANVVALIDGTSATIRKAQAEGRDPSTAEWDALNAQIDSLRDQLRAP